MGKLKSAVGKVVVVGFVLLAMAGCGGNGSSASGNQAATPAFSPGGGSYKASQTVTISDATPGAVLYCTTDGTTPTTSSPQCSQPTTVFKTEFLQAIAVAPGMSASAVASAGYTINLNSAATPTFSPAGGLYTSAQTVSIGDTTTGANIYYTTDGSSPTASSTLYTGPITISQSQTLSALATASGYNNSDVAVATYTIQSGGQGQILPTILSLSPASATAGGAAFTLTVNGANFVSGATVQWGSIALTTTVVSSTQLSAAVPASLIASAGTASVTATESSATSNSATFTISPVPLAPTISSLSPSSATAGGAEFTLTINGANFDSGTTVQWGTTSLARSFVSATQLSADVPPGLIATPGTATVTVTSSGGTSSGATFTISAAAPAITGLSPASGTTAGGTSVTITGTGFTGATAVEFGGTPATSFTVNSASSITAISPAAGSGIVDIRVITPSGTSAASAADKFSYAVPAPTVTSVNTSSGPAAGGTSVTVTGSNFTGATAVNFGSIAATSFTMNSGTSITAVSPAGSGTVNIEVVTAGGTSAAVTADQFTYIPAPVVTGVTTASGTSGGTTSGGTSVTIAGSNFTGATAVYFGSTQATSFLVTSATNITADSPAESAGTVNITVVTPGGTSPVSAADQFTYALPLPAVTSISPTVGPTAGATSVTITGSNFTGATAVNFGSTPAANFTVNSATTITATSPAQSAGAVDIRVVTAIGTSAVVTADQFTYATGPAVGTVSPASGPAAGGTSVAVSGVNFNGATAVSFGSTPATSFTVNSGTSITAVSPAGSSTVDIRVTTPNGGTSAVVSTDQFTYAPIPAVTAIGPSSGTTAGGTSVTITGNGFSGTNFTSTAVNFGSTPATNFTVNSATSITAVSPAESAGTVDIEVTTPGGTSITSAVDRFTYAVPVPAVTSISPASGYTTGGTTVVITGSNFGDATVVNFGGVPATSFMVNSSTSITAVSPVGSVGTVDISVVTPSGTSATGNGDQFTYSLPAPAVTGASPAVGVTAGGTTVAITGTYFTGATAVNFGGTAAANFTVNSATSITSTSPAGSSGTVDITVVTPSGTSATSSMDQFTYGPIIGGHVSTGSSPISGAAVQLYAAGTTGYGSMPSPLPVNGSVTTDANGNFAMLYTCPAAPGDQLYLVATGGNSGSGTNQYINLMTALGSCNNSTNIAQWSSVVVNEVTTVASAYALSAFATVNTGAGGEGIDVGAPALVSDASCNAADNWQSTAPAACNYTGLSNAFEAVNNLVNIGTGAALAHTPAYPANLAADTNILNNSTVPQARINALADMLASCVESNGSDCSGNTNLFGVASTTTTTPVDTLQAALNIAQNPGNHVSTLLGLASSMPTPPYSTGTLLTQTTLPTDLTLALTFTGAGLGIAPGITLSDNNTGIDDGALGINAAGNVWVAAYRSGVGGVGEGAMIAEFNALGAPVTAATSLSAASPPVPTYGGYDPEPSLTANIKLTMLAVDQPGNLWTNDSDGNMLEINPSLSQLGTAISVGSGTVNLAIDSSGDAWYIANSGNEVREILASGSSGIQGGPISTAKSMHYLAFDSNGGLWTAGKNSSSKTDIFQINTSNGTIAYNAFPSSTGTKNTTLAADGNGNIYGCDPTGLKLDVFSTGALESSNSISPATGRACGTQLVLDGQGHLFAVSNTSSVAIIDEFTTSGTLISPSSTGYTGTSSVETPTLNADPTFGNSGVPGVSAAIDGSGNLWVLNADTTGPTTSGNVLVEYVGIGAPVVTPASTALENGLLGVRP